MAEILPIVLNKNFERIGMLDDLISVIWTKRYYVHGDFQIQIPINPDNVSKMVIGNYIVRDDDECVGIIEKIDLSYSEDSQRILTASGRFLTVILSRRIIAEQTQVNGTLDFAINKLINDAIISPEIAARQISNFILGNYELSQTISCQYTGKNLYEVISELALQYGFGFRIRLNDSNQFVFELYEGVDRSYNQNINPYIVFSEEYDNLLNSEYIQDWMNVITDVLAAGEGEGIDRKTVWVTNADAPTGIDRYEFYDDSRNTSSNEGEIPEEQYIQELAEIGRENLTAYTVTLSGEVDSRNVKFGEDVDIGDIVTIENKSIGYYTNVRIIELIESVDSSGMHSIIPTFGS